MVVEDAKHNKDWRANVALVASEAMKGREVFSSPVALRVDFIMPRPKNHYGKKGLKTKAPQAHSSRPDLTKLTRCLEDALTGIVWTDDALIHSQVLRKRYTLNANDCVGALIDVSQLIITT